MKVEIDPSIFLTYRARDIQTSFSDQPTCVEVTDSAISAIENLDRRAYDQAPVTENGNVIGWVMRENIKSTRTIAESYNLLNQNDLISAEAPLNDLLKRLLNQKLVFLVGATGIEGFAVRSDLERHVSRAHLYLLISGLEISMTRILSSYLNDISCVLPLMSPPSKRAFEFALAKREDANPSFGRPRYPSHETAPVSPSAIRRLGRIRGVRASTVTEKPI